MSLPIVEQMLNAMDTDANLGAQDWWMDEFGLPDEYEDGIQIGNTRWAVLEGAEPHMHDLRKYFDVQTIGSLVLVPWDSRPPWD